MDDLISRQAALDAMDTWDKFGCRPDGKLVRCDDDNHYVPYVHYDDMVHAIKNLPSAQPEKTQLSGESTTKDSTFDCISRQAAIDALGDMVMNWTDSEYELGQLNQWKEDRKAIIDLPSAQPQWIPVTERLPERGKDVLVTRDYDGRADHIKSCRYVEVASCYGEDDDVSWNSYSDEYKMTPKNHRVLAWMPLPESYKGE